jgi:hypothetical protein
MAATPLERTPGSHARLCPSTPTDRGLYLDGQEGASRSISSTTMPMMASSISFATGFHQRSWPLQEFSCASPTAA